MWWVILAIHLLAAWFSVGHHHPDEHFQILELAWYRSGLAHSSEAVAWEFSSQIRSGLAPWIASRVMLALPAADPETIARILRTVASL
ncbi:MAG: hypothetical protein KGQ59_10015, partial [Bdellovibrionales bacterium]|nr:hypothetical protein [Bdellovibrionales bacterium]